MTLHMATISRARGSRWLLAACLALCSMCHAAGAEEPASETGAEAALANPQLDGDEIYRRVLDNRFDSYEEQLRMVSGDAAGNQQSVDLTLKYLNLEGTSKKILSKSIAKYEAPQDVRHLGYLVINKRKGNDDQFVYRPSARRVRRINLRGEAVAGTDFAFEDVIPQEFEDASYKRLPDARIQERDCYVVEVYPTVDADSEYTKLEVSVDQRSFVPLQTRYWDNRKVLIKELRAQADSIEHYEEEHGGVVKEVFVARQSKMAHLLLGSYTDLSRSGTRPNRKLRERDFSERELTAGR
jgi:hypothetical protein